MKDRNLTQKEYFERLKNPIKLRCNRCGNIWLYRGKKKVGFTSCTQCRNSNVNIEKHVVVDDVPQ